MFRKYRIGIMTRNLKITRTGFSPINDYYVFIDDKKYILRDDEELNIPLEEGSYKVRVGMSYFWGKTKAYNVAITDKDYELKVTWIMTKKLYISLIVLFLLAFFGTTINNIWTEVFTYILCGSFGIYYLYYLTLGSSQYLKIEPR